jgi:hypothetical protein
MRAALTALALPLVALAAQAQPMMKPSGEPCTLPEVLMAWNKPPATIASMSERRAADLAGSVNQPYRVSLAPCEAAWCKPGGHAAMVKFDVPQAGRWRVALDTMLWIDVWTADAKLEGVLCEHHGCQPLRKIVQYDLRTGPHWVVVEGKAPGQTGLLLTRLSD